MKINGIDFFEYAKTPKSPKISGSQDDGRIVRDLWTRATNDAQRWAAEKAILGYPTVQTETILGVVRTWIDRSTVGKLPAAYPAQADADLNPKGTSFLWASNFDPCEPDGAPTGTGADANGSPIYEISHYRVTFETRDYFIKLDKEVGGTGASPLAAGIPGIEAVARPDEGSILALNGWLSSRFVSRFYKPGSRTLTLRDGFLRNVRLTAAGAKTTAIMQGIAIRESISDVTYVWNQIPLVNLGTGKSGVPFKAIADQLSCCNVNAFDGFAAQTLMFDSVEMKQVTNKLGQVICTLRYNFKHLPHFDRVSGTAMGWNSFMEAAGGQLRYDAFSSDGLAPLGTNAPFVPKPFDALFRPDQV